MKVQSALIQMNFSVDIAENVQRAASSVREAAGRGAKIICLPELATSMYFCTTIDPAHLEIAEPVPGPSTEVIAAAAKECNVYVIFPQYEQVAAGVLYNTAVVIGPDGSVVGKYRKNHIPLVDSAEGVGLEKYYFRPGNLGHPVFDTNLGVKMGVIICYERHFPEAPRALALAGADIIFVPTATPGGRDIWELELRAHAVANSVWVAGVNRVGRDRGGSTEEFFGASVVVSPTGEIVAQASDTEETIVEFEIDTEAGARLRNDWGFFRDRRPELYTGITAA